MVLTQQFLVSEYEAMAVGRLGGQLLADPVDLVERAVVDRGRGAAGARELVDGNKAGIAVIERVRQAREAGWNGRAGVVDGAVDVAAQALSLREIQFETGGGSSGRLMVAAHRVKADTVVVQGLRCNVPGIEAAGAAVVGQVAHL